MQKRVFQRIYANMQTDFFYDNTICKGIVINLSENDMCIITRMCFPIESQLEILIPMKEDVLKVPVKVRRTQKIGYYFDAMGVELLRSPRGYLEFINKLRLTLKILKHPPIKHFRKDAKKGIAVDKSKIVASQTLY